MTDDMLTHYSRALDEIYRMRVGLAYELATAQAALSYRSLPKAVRESLESQVERLQEALTGSARHTYGEIRGGIDKNLLQQAGAATTLTRSGWEQAAL